MKDIYRLLIGRVRRWYETLRGWVRGSAADRLPISAILTRLERFPERIVPGVVMARINETIQLVPGPLQLWRNGTQIGEVQGSLELVWLPDPEVRVSGVIAGSADLDIEADGFEVAGPTLPIRLPVSLAGIQHNPDGAAVRAVLAKTVQRSVPSVNAVWFKLVRFPDFHGDRVRYSTAGGSHGLVSGRMQMTANELSCTIDEIVEVEALIKSANQEAGYIISHVGRLEKVSSPLAPDEVSRLVPALHWLFAFMRGARCGPVLVGSGPSFKDDWLEIGSPKLHQARTVSTWLPLRSPLQMDDLFSGFMSMWSDTEWNPPMRTAIAWYLGANDSNVAHEVRIPLTQIALELLAWVHLVEKTQREERAIFDALPAHERVRRLLRVLDIPTSVPDRMNKLARLAADWRIDAPESLTRLRNKLEHPTTTNRRHLEKVDGVHLLQAAELGLEYVELVLLALFGYRGKHARRAFPGWVGADEALVPWAQSEQGMLQ